MNLRRGAAAVAAAGLLSFGVLPSPASAANIEGTDRFENAPLLPADGGVFRGSNRHFTTQPGEPDAGGEASAWYRWRPTSSGPVRITTRGSAIDTILAVYRGPDLQHLALVGANDDGEHGFWSRVWFEAQAGVTYRISVGGFTSSDDVTKSGRYALRVTPL